MWLVLIIFAILIVVLLIDACVLHYRTAKMVLAYEQLVDMMQKILDMS